MKWCVDVCVCAVAALSVGPIINQRVRFIAAHLSAPRRPLVAAAGASLVKMTNAAGGN